MEIRELGADDISAVLAMWSEAGLAFRPEGRDSPQAFARELTQARSFLVGAFEDAMIGVALGTDDGRKGWVNRVAVRPGYKRQGVARKLIAHCEAIFEERGIGLVCCLIEDGNDASIALFQSEGYDLRRDIVYLRKPLQDDSW